MAVDIKAGLEHKVGPLPMWAWGGIAIVGFIVYSSYAKSSGGNTVAQEPNVADSTIPPPWWYNQTPGSVAGSPVGGNTTTTTTTKPVAKPVGKKSVAKKPVVKHHPKPEHKHVPTPTPIHHPPVKGHHAPRKPTHVAHRINTKHKVQGFNPTPVHVINKSGGHVTVSKPVSRKRVSVPLRRGSDHGGK